MRVKCLMFAPQIEKKKNYTTLTIKQVFPEDSGLITCRLKNKLGVTECSAELYVQGKSGVYTWKHKGCKGFTLVNQE